MGTSPQNVGGRNPGKVLPDYASKIRELRKTTGLTQPQFAAELNVKRSAVAKWEGGVREPRDQNYLAMAEFSRRQKLPEFVKFFRQHFEDRKSDRQKKWDEIDALRYLAMLEERAKEGGDAAQRAKRLLELSAENHSEYGHKRVAAFVKEHKGKSLEDAAAGSEFLEMMDEASRIGRLQRARRIRAFRRAAILRRQSERLTARQREVVKSGEIQHQELERVLDENAALVKEGKASDIVTLAKKVADAIHKGPQARSRKRQTISAIVADFKVDRISALFAEAAAAEEKGEPLDSVQFTNRLERLLEIGREPKKGKE